MITQQQHALFPIQHAILPFMLTKPMNRKVNWTEHNEQCQRYSLHTLHIVTLISEANGNGNPQLIALQPDCGQLTWMQFQIRYEFLQLATQYQFGTVFGLCAIVDEQEIRMAIVQHGQFRSEIEMKNSSK